MEFLAILIAVCVTGCALIAPRRTAIWFPVLLPLYVVRARLELFPTTALELSALMLFAIVTLNTPKYWMDGWKKITPWRGAIIAWSIATLIAVFVAPNHVSALGLWRAYVLEPLLYFILLAGVIQTERDRRHVVHALITATTFIFVWALVQFASGMGIPHPWDTSIATRRATGPFPFPNALALWSAPIAALSIARLSFGEFKDKPELYWINLGILSGIGATLLAKSAGGTIAILVAGFIALALNKKTRLPAIATIATALLIALAVPQIRTPLIQLLTFQDWSGKVRLIIYHETSNMLKDHAIFGAGFGAYPDVIKPYHTATYIEIFQFPHNILLNVWSETGLLGVAAFVWICVIWFRLCWKRPDGEGSLRPYVFPLIAILVHGLVDVPYFKNDLAMAFWTLAALTITLQKVNLPPPNSKHS